jgi:hypothetical protein
MSKSGFRNLNSVMLSIKKAISVPWTNSELNEIGKKSRDLIVGTVRSGKNPKDDSKMYPITDEWAQRRDDIAKANSASDVYSKNRSNLSLTGELLASIAHSSDVNAQKIVIEAKGSHSPYKSPKTGKPLGGSVENSKIIEGQKSQGRDILGLSERLNKQIITLMRRIYRNKIKEAKARLGFK